MMLYHGTLASNVEAILRDGLCPRGNNPSHDVYLERPSLPEFVYLRDIYELLTDTGRYGYKQRKRNQTIKIEPDKTYAPSEVAAALNLSYDAASRLMLKMKGVVDYGTPTRRYKRGKKKLRISGKNLLEFQRSKARG